MTAPRARLGPILAAHLYPQLETRLIALLRSLAPEEWERQTLAPRWKVRDVAAHLLDTQLRKLSLARDGHQLDAPRITSERELAEFINRMNAEGVALYRRLSPAVLIGLMEYASAESAHYHMSLDPYADAAFGVSWAGQSRSPNWFDTARELTERWHHQQQIREAVGKPGIMTPEFYHPVLDCFMRALPFAYRQQSAPVGTLLRFNVAGECGGSWFLYREDGGWELLAQPEAPQARAEISIPQQIAWRLFTKGIDKQSAAAQTAVTGDREFATPLLNMVCIVG